MAYTHKILRKNMNTLIKHCNKKFKQSTKYTFARREKSSRRYKMISHMVSPSCFSPSSQIPRTRSQYYLFTSTQFSMSPKNLVPFYSPLSMISKTRFTPTKEIFYILPHLVLDDLCTRGVHLSFIFIEMKLYSSSYTMTK